MDKSLEVAAKLADTLFTSVSKLVESWGPQAVDLVLWVVRIDAISDIFVGVVFLSFIIGSIFLIPYFYKKYSEAERAGRKYEGKLILCGLMIGGQIIVNFIAVIVICFTLLNFWNYVAVVKPELYLAKKVMDKAIEATKK
jgi:hypothetical protein